MNRLTTEQRVRAAESAYWLALGAAEEAGLVTVHNHSFSWNL
jgi:hypothetical protein